MTILDAGTGTGYLAGMMALLAGNVIGVDCASAMLARDGEKMAQAGYQHLSLREGMAERLLCRPVPLMSPYVICRCITL